MTALNKQALREAANAANIASWGKWESYKPHKGARGYEVKVGAKAAAQHCLKVDAAFITTANPQTVLALLDELDSAEKLATQQGNIAVALLDEVTTLRRNADDKTPELRAQLIEADNELETLRQRIAELQSSHSKLRDTIAAIHNTIRMDGGYTPLAAILNAAKRAYEESASAAGIGVKGE